MCLSHYTGMEDENIDAKEKFQVNEDSQHSLDKDVCVVQESDLILSASKLKVALERVTQNQQLTPETKQQKITQTGFHETCLQNQCVSELWVPKNMSFISLRENLARHHLDLLEIRASDSLSIFCRAETASATPVSFPSNLRSSKLEILFNSLKSHRRTRSTSDLGLLFTESALASGPGNVIFNPVGQLFADVIDRSNKVRSIMNTPLFCHLSAPDGNMDLGKAKFSGVKDSKCSELTRSPLGKGISSLQKQVRKLTPPRRLRYGLEITDKTLVSCSSTNTTSSYQSTSSFCGAASIGLLHCIWKDGLPYFMFSVDDRGDVYVASPCKVESLTDKALDYIYLFHSNVEDKKESRGDSVSNLVGKMKVSSSLSLDNLKLMETEFILFGTGEDDFAEVQSSSRMIRRNKVLPKKVVDLFKTNHSCKHRSVTKGFISGDLSYGPCLDVLNTVDELGKMNLTESYVPSNLELAAIVVKGFQSEKTQEAVAGGWGLNFLKKVKMEHVHSSGSCQQGHLRNQSRPINSLNVLVPAGLHGGPKTRNGGPSSLTERWRSGGHCDCGGWDTGCPLTVLNCQSSSMENSSKADTQDCNSFNLFVEGAKEGEPSLKMVNIHEGLYFIHFKSTMSALQSFSIGVAILHSRSPSLCPKLYRK